VSAEDKRPREISGGTKKKTIVGRGFDQGGEEMGKRIRNQFGAFAKGGGFFVLGGGVVCGFFRGGRGVNAWGETGEFREWGRVVVDCRNGNGSGPIAQVGLLELVESG